MDKLSYKNDYEKIFKINIDEMQCIIIPFFIVMTIVYSLEYHNTRYAKTFLQSSNIKELYTETFVNACMGMIVACYMMFSRGKHWKASLLSIFGLFVFVFAMDTITEASGFNRFINRYDYSQLDSNSNDIVDDTLTTTNEIEKEYPFIKSFMYSILVFVALYFAIKLIHILKCAYYGYIDVNGKNHIQNEIFWAGKIEPKYGFGFEIIVIIATYVLGAWLKQIFCEQHMNHTDVHMVALWCVALIVNHIVFQYVGMYNN